MRAEPLDQVRFRILGPLEIRTGQEWQAIGAPKWRSILAVLLLNAGQVVPVDGLIGELWEGDPPSRAARLVSIYVLRLRRLIDDPEGRLLVTRAPGYQLRLGAAGSDLQRFEALLRGGRRALTDSDPERAANQLAEALALWRGRPLVDIPLTPLIEIEADRLTELRVQATELRITAELACGKPPTEVVHELRGLIGEQPLRESAWLLLIRALDNAGRHAEAMDAYSQARKVIAAELGVDPDPELRQLYARMLAADSANARGAPAATRSRAIPVPALVRNPPGELVHDRHINRISGRPARPQPQKVASREDFGRALTTVRVQAGLTVEEAAEAAGITARKADDYFTGRDLPSSSEAGLKTLRTILAACAITDLEQVIAWTDALARVWPQAAPRAAASGTGNPGEAARRARRVPAPVVPDTAGFDLRPDPLTAQTAGDFVKALSQFRVWAGEPSFREMALLCGHAVSAATMCTALGRDKLPSQRVVLAIIKACGGTPDHQREFVTAWRMLRTPRGSGMQTGSRSGKRTLYPVSGTA
jgi:DNA-binding SARP family transcriptional activator/transcriptional regulator with XRE-family HTH domain